MEGRYNQTAGPPFRGHEPKRSERQAVIRLEIVQQAALAAIGEDFIVNVKEDFLGKHLDLKAHLITDPMSAQQTSGVLPAQAIAEQAALIGQRLIGSGRDLCQDNVAVFPGDDMAGPGDSYGQLVIFALNPSCSRATQKPVTVWDRPCCKRARCARPAMNSNAPIT